MGHEDILVADKGVMRIFESLFMILKKDWKLRPWLQPYPHFAPLVDSWDMFDYGTQI